MMGRDVASQLGKHEKAEAAAQLAARKNASKRRKPSKNASKVKKDETSCVRPRDSAFSSALLQKSRVQTIEAAPCVQLPMECNPDSRLL